MFDDKVSGLINRREIILEKLNIIEKLEGIDNTSISKKVAELNNIFAQMLQEKDDLKENFKVQLSTLDVKLTETQNAIQLLSGKGVQDILGAIKKQRWYYFKKNPKITLDRDTGILWLNISYFKNFCESGNPIKFWKKTIELELNKLKQDYDVDKYDWTIPTIEQLIKITKNEKFPLPHKDAYELSSNNTCWAVNNNVMVHYCFYTKQMGICPDSTAYILPCNTSLHSSDYEKNVSSENFIFTDNDRAQFTLALFSNNQLEPTFSCDDITKLYKAIFIEKPGLLLALNEVEKQILEVQKPILLSSSLDYNSILKKYDIVAINSSVIKYYKAVKSFVDELLESVDYFQRIKSDVINDFNVIALKLSKKHEPNSNLTDLENNLLKKRQETLKDHFELGMYLLNTRLLAIKKQAENIEERIKTINSGENTLKDLAILEKEERACFSFVAENAINLLVSALEKIEYFEKHKIFAKKIVAYWDNWNEEYKKFKTVLREDLKNSSENDNIDSEVYSNWYTDWQKRRFIIEEKFMLLIEYALKGNLNECTEDEIFTIEKIILILEKYKDEIDKFYIEERKNIYQKFAFEPGGDLLEKFEVASEIFKLTSKLPSAFEEIIYSCANSEDRIFLLTWVFKLLDFHIDEVIDFTKECTELSTVFFEILNAFSSLKNRNYDLILFDCKVYAEELQKREKEFNSLIFKMKKELVKQ